MQRHCQVRNGRRLRRDLAKIGLYKGESKVRRKRRGAINSDGPRARLQWDVARSLLCCQGLENISRCLREIFRFLQSSPVQLICNSRIFSKAFCVSTGVYP